MFIIQRIKDGKRENCTQAFYDTDRDTILNVDLIFSNPLDDSIEATKRLPLTFVSEKQAWFFLYNYKKTRPEESRDYKYEVNEYFR